MKNTDSASFSVPVILVYTYTCSDDTPYAALGQELENELKRETPYAKLVEGNALSTAGAI